jgi:hypothetical protein
MRVKVDQVRQQSLPGSLPSSEPDLYVAPEKTFVVRQDTTLKLFSKSG